MLQRQGGVAGEMLERSLLKADKSWRLGFT
jgi:hypothetical protein